MKIKIGLGLFGLVLLMPVLPAFAEERKESSEPAVGEENYWDPYEEMQALQDRMNQLMQLNAMRPITGAQPVFQMYQAPVAGPAIDLEETTDAYVVKASLPGFDKDQIDLEVKGNVLTIKGIQKRDEKKEGQTAEGKKYYIHESRSGSFVRAIVIPGKFDENAIKAEYKNGVLTVTLPKVVKEVPIKAKKIIVI